MTKIPTIARHRLFLIAGIAWTCVGFLLCGRAISWLILLPSNTELQLESAAIAIAGAGYFFGFSKVVQKNVDRINQLPADTPLYSFTAPRGYVLIAFMVATGLTLRGSSLPKVYLTIPYLAMGFVLLLGSVRYYKEFIRMGSLAKMGDNKR